MNEILSVFQKSGLCSTQPKLWRVQHLPVWFDLRLNTRVEKRGTRK